MKKLLLALLATTIATPALAQNWNYATQNSNYKQTQYQPLPQTKKSVNQAQKKKETSKYRLANPLYRPAAQGFVLEGEIDYSRSPKDNAIGQPSSGSWDFIPAMSFGLTDKLSLDASAGYSRTEIKSGAMKGSKLFSYQAQANLSYLIASVDDFDFNVEAGLFYTQGRRRVGAARQNFRSTGTNIGLQVGKKIENVTPYFGIGFTSDFWSKRGNSRGTNTYINPGIYIDLAEQVSLNLSYESVVHQEATYKAVVDFYPQDNVVFGVGAFIVHPETEVNEYGALVNFKLAF